MWAVVLTLAVAAWPPEPGTSPAALLLPENHPRDPEYAPWTQSASCAGQFELLSVVPPCAEQRRGGVGVDAAWSRTVGHASVTIAVLGGGLSLDSPDLSPKLRLNPGELSAEGSGPLDRDRDGVITVHDFTTIASSSTAALSVDTVVDARLRGRSDRGDTNGNGFLDVEDLVAVFSDGVDDDGNGRVDDLVGWSYVDASPRPGAASAHTTLAALAAAARTDDGVGRAGACPRCTVLPFEVARAGLARTDVVVAAIDHALDYDAQVILLTTALPASSSALLAAVDRAARRGAVVVVDAGASPFGSRVVDLPLDHPAAVLVSGAAFAEPGAARPKLPCAKSALRTDLKVGGLSCPETVVAAGVVAGVAGLMLDAGARGGGGRPPPDEPPSPEALVAHLRRSRAEDGVLDAGRAVDEVLEGQPIHPLRWQRPALGQLVDPAQRLRIRAVVTTTIPAPGLDAVVSIGPLGTSDALEVVATESLGRGEALDLELDLSGRLQDPAMPPDSDDSKAFLLEVSLRGPSSTTRSQRWFFVDADLQRLPGFPIRVAPGVAASPRLADTDGDGRDEIFVLSLDGQLVRLDGRASLERVSFGGRFLTAPALRNGSELCAVDSDGVAHLWSPGSAPRTRGTPLRGRSSPCMVDGRGDFRWVAGDTELRHATQAAVSLSEASGPLARVGEELWAVIGSELVDVAPNPPVPRPFEASAFRPQDGLAQLFPGGPVVGRLEGGRSVIAPTAPGAVAFRADGTQEHLQLPGESILWSGRLAAARGDVLAWLRRGGGPPEPVGLSTAETRPDAFDPALADIVVADLDGGAPEWIGSSASRLLAVSENGRPAAGWPKQMDGPMLGAPAIGDLDGDGQLEVVAVSRAGQVYAWRTHGRLGAFWAGARHDATASGNADAAVSATPESSCRSASAPSPWGLALLAGGGLLRRRRKRRNPSDP